MVELGDFKLLNVLPASESPAYSNDHMYNSGTQILVAALDFVFEHGHIMVVTLAIQITVPNHHYTLKISYRKILLP